jgi:hypothetical protein
MNLNFKKNNLLIILLLIFVILSCIVFVNMSNVKESFDNLNSNSKKYFMYYTSDSSYNVYMLNPWFTYNLSSLPSGLQNKNIQYSTSFNYRFFKENNVLISYYHTEEYDDISYLNIIPNTTIMLDISTIPTSREVYTPRSKTLDMVFLENSGNFYDFSNQKLSKFSMKINGENVIVNGQVFQPPTPPTPTTEASANILNNPQANNFYNDFNLYLLRQGAFGSNYIPPIYNNFETAMNLPSNPIVNPVNTMNPLDYANTLFGPNVSPTMISNMCLNQNVAKVDDNNTIIREVSNNLVSNSRNNNSRNTNSTNSSNNNSRNTNSTNSSNNSSNTNSSNNSSNANSSNTNSSNTNSSNNSFNTNRNQNFMRESYPPYQSPLLVDSSQENKDSEFIPRPVLTDFSSFGM